MPRIVGVHGIARQFKGEHTLLEEGLPALQDGLRRVNVRFHGEDMVCAFSGDLFRPSGGKGVGDPQYAAQDITDEWERGMVEAWWREVAAVDPAVPEPDAQTKARTPQAVQRALRALSERAFGPGSQSGC